MNKQTFDGKKVIQKWRETLNELSAGIERYPSDASPHFQLETAIPGQAPDDR